MKLAFACLLVGLQVAAVLVTPARAQSEAKRPDYQSQRQNEDWSVLRDPELRTGPLDDLKYVSLDASGKAYISFGGSARYRYNYYSPDRFGLSAVGDEPGGIFLQRYLMHGDLHLSDPLRVFFELGHHIASKDDFPPGPNDRDFFDVSQAFVDLKADLGADAKAQLRAGRQHVVLGSSRLVSLREGPNVRQRFEGFRGTLSPSSSVSIDFLALRDVLTSPRAFDDTSQNGDELWGAYGVFKGLGGTPINLDLYYLGLNRKDPNYTQVLAGTLEHRHSVGARVWGKAQGFDWNVEGVGQFGSVGDTDVRAWTLASTTGYTFEQTIWQPRLFLSANIASGDDNPKDGVLRTFNPLFPRLPYFDEATYLAPQNFMNLQPGIEIKPHADVKLGFNWDFFWRQSERDAVYSRGLNPLLATDDVDGRFVTHAPTVSLEWQIAPEIDLAVHYTHFFAGEVIENAGGDDSDFAMTALTVRF
jgi:hypothetical protein